MLFKTNCPYVRQEECFEHRAKQKAYDNTLDKRISNTENELEVNTRLTKYVAGMCSAIFVAVMTAIIAFILT